MIAGRLGREATLLKGGKYIKDLSYMNREIKDIIYVDFTDEKTAYHKDNCILIPNWQGEAEDRELYDLLPYLESNKISK
jgi:import inner membrane translocase subunit TIM50